MASVQKTAGVAAWEERMCECVDDCIHALSATMRAALLVLLCVVCACAEPQLVLPALSTLHTALRRQQHPAATLDACRFDDTAAASPGLDAAAGLRPARRFLVFTYGPEQSINGFAAMFQWQAAALALARRYGRTLVELAPPPPAPPAATAQPAPTAGNKTGGLEARLRAARAELRRVAPGGLYARVAAANDPWQRAPLAACGGAKAGCFLEPPSACGLTLLPADILAQMQLPVGEAAAATGASVGGVDALPLLDVAAEEERRLLLHSGTPASGGDAAAALVVRVDTIARYRDAMLAVTAGLAPSPLQPPACGCAPQPDATTATFAAAVERACAQAVPSGSTPAPLYCSESTDVVTGSVRQEACVRTAGAALTKEACAAKSPCAGAITAWQRLWFPAHQAYHFRPRTAVPLASDVTPTVAVHFRAGDAAHLAWRVHAPLGAYVRQALCAATALPAVPPWALFLASDSAQARTMLAREVALQTSIIAFDTSVAPPDARLLQACGERAGTTAPAALKVSAAAVLVTAQAQDAYAHIETWIAEQRERLQPPVQLPDDPATADDEEADAAYLAHLAVSTAALPGGAAHLRVFAIHRHSYSLLSEATDDARRALDDAMRLLLDDASGSTVNAAEVCELAIALAHDLGVGDGDNVRGLAVACGMASRHVAASAAAVTTATAAAIAGVTAGIVADVAALAASAALVGTCLSQVSRLAYELSYAAGLARLPPVALDAHLCAGAPHAHAILAEWRAPTE